MDDREKIRKKIAELPCPVEFRVEKPCEEKETFGHWMAEKRRKLKLSQKELGDVAGVSRNYVSYLERGDNYTLRKVSLGVIADIAHALGYGMEISFGEDLVEMES